MVPTATVCAKASQASLSVGHALPTSGPPACRWAAPATCRRWRAGRAAAGGGGRPTRARAAARRAPRPSCSPTGAPQGGAPAWHGCKRKGRLRPIAWASRHSLHGRKVRGTQHAADMSGAGQALPGQPLPLTMPRCRGRLSSSAPLAAPLPLAPLPAGEPPLDANAAAPCALLPLLLAACAAAAPLLPSACCAAPASASSSAFTAPAAGEGWLREGGMRPKVC